ncbi:MAG: hypothetical protein A2W93_14380 [Bacteroidetes bacterium GWF2_43_63]|nr:MAG: hypothetical protein A2W94_00950 [Bacteroidetes bacterium GWE2_42_42]OFY52528.1 MAG: hypothetical protein A2W93_14380 [Bacteroidetes bacterium GWF2_43_63]HBG71435.1 hypothetical protein [Bacteroidales bacterium]HCB60813.1 hypothetical protein [Bacteroidales bacterium]HCY23462.1 hypothetical protein [Bacteroidales bacterium]
MNATIIEIVEKNVCDRYGVKPAMIKQRTRMNVYLIPRQITTTIIDELVKADRTKLMKRYDLDRTSFYNNRRSVNNMRETNIAFAAIYNELKRRSIVDIKANGFSDVLISETA